MAFDINNQYTGNLFGRDRIGHTTPDAEATEVLRPWLPVPYPAPYLPTARQDQGHPVLANVVLSSQQLVGQDSSGGFAPAGLFCGTQYTIAGIASYNSTNGTNISGWCALRYSASDVGFAYNAITGALVAAAGEVAVLACPSDATDGVVLYFSDGTTYTTSAGGAGGAGDCASAKACTLFGSAAGSATSPIVNKVRPIGLTIRNVFQYLGGVNFTSTTPAGGYQLNGVIPVKFKVHNYMHEMGTAIQTAMVIRLPWIGLTPNTLTLDTGTDGVSGYVQSNYGRSFVHFTGTPQFGQLVQGSALADGVFATHASYASGDDAGHYAPWDGLNVADVCGRVVGIQNMYPIRDYANRVRTLWDPSRLVGPIKDPNPSSIMMGGSQTGGIDYALNLGTDGAFKKAYDQGKTLRSEYSTYVLVKVGSHL